IRRRARSSPRCRRRPSGCGDPCLAGFRSATASGRLSLMPLVNSGAAGYDRLRPANFLDRTLARGRERVDMEFERAATLSPRPMVDPFGRGISYLRVSVTDRCDFRCVYCMAENMAFLPKHDLLTLEELDRLCSAFIVKGVRKLRLTGGEPLVRRGIMTLFQSLARHLAEGTLDELTLTTNGSQLPRYAGELAACGVKRINVSLDTRDGDKFRAITRWRQLTT